MDKAQIIHGALSSKLLAFGVTSSISVYHEGLPAIPSGTYLREWLMLGRPRAAGCGPNAKNYSNNTYQVDVVTDMVGWGTAYEKADDVATEFKRGTVISATGARIVCQSVAIGPAFRDESKYILPVSINFYVYVEV